MEEYVYQNTNYKDELPINLYETLKLYKKEDIDYIVVYAETTMEIPIDEFFELTKSIHDYVGASYNFLIKLKNGCALLWSPDDEGWKMTLKMLPNDDRAPIGHLKTLSTNAGIYSMKDTINNYAINQVKNLPEPIQESTKSAIIDGIIKKHHLEKYYEDGDEE